MVQNKFPGIVYFSPQCKQSLKRKTFYPSMPHIAYIGTFAWALLIHPSLYLSQDSHPSPPKWIQILLVPEGTP